MINKKKKQNRYKSLKQNSMMNVFAHSPIDREITEVDFCSIMVERRARKVNRRQGKFDDYSPYH